MPYPIHATRGPKSRRRQCQSLYYSQTENNGNENNHTVVGQHPTLCYVNNEDAPSAPHVFSTRAIGGELCSSSLACAHCHGSLDTLPPSFFPSRSIRDLKTDRSCANSSILQVWRYRYDAFVPSSYALGQHRWRIETNLHSIVFRIMTVMITTLSSGTQHSFFDGSIVFSMLCHRSASLCK
jgi:hypothetical protein